PGISDSNSASEMLGSTAKLEFKNADGNVLFEGDKVKAAAANYGPVSNSLNSEHYVSLEFTDEGRKLFAAATEAAAKRKADKTNYIDIELDGINISHASVETKINSNSCTISGSFTQEEAVELAGLIGSGNLPVELTEEENRVVGATLGSDALSSSLKAGLIGILLVMIFMILIYRLPGFVSAITLVGYIAIFAIFVVFFKVNLSLPGIAGIILTIGMAVDANVIIYERIKEELNVGKTVRNAVKNGFKGATSAIVDSNITTIIAAVVLVAMGTGAVYGFGITLLVGTLISMFTALVITRVFLTTLANMGVGAWIMGAKRNRKVD
ncbi:MAG: protein translocase subunit SecD, partial [Clostridia bacterium]|nr:protein translocase subunit SecD [Clostridia bacterium]